MKTTLGVHDFRQAFKDWNRMGGWSYEGLEALFDYLEEYEEDSGIEMELDVVGLCCDFSEYKTAVEAANEYGSDWADLDDLDKDEIEEAAVEYLQDNTQAITFDGGIIVQGF